MEKRAVAAGGRGCVERLFQPRKQPLGIVAVIGFGACHAHGEPERLPCQGKLAAGDGQPQTLS
jgi:hypothetical protein